MEIRAYEIRGCACTEKISQKKNQLYSYEYPEAVWSLVSRGGVRLLEKYTHTSTENGLERTCEDCLLW